MTDISKSIIQKVIKEDLKKQKNLHISSTRIQYGDDYDSKSKK